MRQLIIKDFAVQKKIIVFFVLFVIGFTLAFVVDDKNGNFNAFFLYMVCIPTYNFVTRAALEEEKNNTIRFLDSLPVSRDSIVCARYLSVFGYTLLNLIAFTLADYLSRLFVLGNTENTLRDLAIETFFILILMLINSVYLPFIYKFGYKKAAMINTLAIVAIFAAIGAICSGFKSLSPDFVDRLITPVNITSVIILVLALYLASMEVSIALFKRRNIY
ncbi:MAG TPA: ABC-2 transporter permease [Clostridia bacterium]|nr:ABC-2 transporter permease [Clostridia bacterium]